MTTRRKLILIRDTPSPYTTGSNSSEEDAKEGNRKLPAIGVFWDIENCQVPRGKSAAAVAQAIRSRFFVGRREVEFVVVCDVTKENPRILEELNCAKVNLIHVSATCKNAADDKLRQSIRHFGETYAAGSTLLLISGDINFSSDLIELRHRRMMNIVLLHNTNTSEALKICANEHHMFRDILDHLPEGQIVRDEGNQVEIWIQNVPENEPPHRVRARLKYLCSNCGGRVGFLSRNLYYVRFSSVEMAIRAQRRMDGQDVYGRRISVSEPRTMEWSRTPGRNRPKQEQVELVKPWDALRDVNTNQPLTGQKVASVENLRHLSIGQAVDESQRVQQYQGPQYQSQEFVQPPPPVQNNLLKASFRASQSNLTHRLNNHCDPKSKVFGYSTDSSGGAYDDDSDCEDLAPPKENGGAVDLRVTGLDPQQDLNATRAYMQEAVNKLVKVLNLSVFTQTDGTVVAAIRTKCLADAQLLIANLQRSRVGNQRIKIAFHNTTPEQRQIVRKQVGDLLAKVTDTRIPLFRFQELFKNEYLTSVSVSELRRMRDTCVITDEESGRMIQANPWSRGSPHMQSAKGNNQDGAYCDLHYRASPGFMIEPPGLPSVRMPLNQLAEQVHILMLSHNGRLPLASLEYCYAARFGPLPTSEEDGVALEHLVSYLPGIEICLSPALHKFLSFSSGNEKLNEKRTNGNGGLTTQLLELLKASPKATLSFSAFIPAFHRRFGKQFRLSDFGFTKLQDLLESMPHVVQVTGFGSKKQVTLSHKSQVKRFKIDLQKVLKTLPKKTVELFALPNVYRQVFSKTLEPCQYGVCHIEDLVNCCAGPEFVFTPLEGGNHLIALNVREQTTDELVLTNRFKAEVIELLKHNPDCSMPFNKFVPAYHNYFGKQCRVSSYGFHKLIDLFEAITDTVTVEESNISDEKLLMLTLSVRLQIIGERIAHVVSFRGGSILLTDLEPSYEAAQMGVIDPVQYECDSLAQLLELLVDYVMVLQSPHGFLVQAVPPVDSVTLDLRTRFLLLSRDRLPADSFRALYITTFNAYDINVELALSRIQHCAKLVTQDGIRQIQLTPRAIFANQVYTILFESGGKIPLMNFENAFSRRFGYPLQPTDLGCATISALLCAFPETFSMKSDQPTISFLSLNPAIRDAGFSLPLPPNQTYSLWDRSALFSNVSHVQAPNPTCLPMPVSLLASHQARPSSAPVP